MSPSTWRAVVLAGGRSSRMGRDKALLPWGDATLLTHTHTLLREAGADEVVVSGDRPDVGGVRDDIPDTGPMGALAQLMPRLCDGTWIVVPVDMPLLSADLLAALRANGAACVHVEDHPLPMCLRVDGHVRAIVDEIGQHRGRTCSLRALQERLHATRLPARPWQSVLRNCNTPEDWAALQAAAPSR